MYGRYRAQGVAEQIKELVQLETVTTRNITEGD